MTIPTLALLRNSSTGMRLGCLLMAIGSSFLHGQCPAHGSTSIEEVLRTEAVTCSRAEGSNNQCPLGSRHGEGDSAHAYALIKDCSPVKPRGYLVVPTAKVTGIESPEIESKPYTQLWADAWDWSQRFPEVPREWAALAVNSVRARTVDQLHVHVSCLREEVRDQLQRHQTEIAAADKSGYRLAVLQKDPDTGAVACAVYRVSKMSSLGGEGALKVVKRLHPADRSIYSMDLAVASPADSSGVYVMTYERGGTQQGFAESLMDQTCSDAVRGGTAANAKSSKLPDQTPEELACEKTRDATAPQ